MKKKIFLLAVSLLIFAPYSFALNYIDIPTVKTEEKGRFGLQFRVFGKGSLLTRFTVGINHFITLGVPFEVENFIGQENLEADFPILMMLKIKIEPSSTYLPLIGLGYDPVKYGQLNLAEEKVERGGYLVFGCRERSVGGIKYYLSAGFSAPLRDYEPEGIIAFGGLKVAFNENLSLLAEIDQVYLSAKDREKAKYNAGFKYKIVPNLSFTFGLRQLTQNRPERIVSINYQGGLF